MIPISENIRAAIASGDSIDWPALRLKLHDAHALAQSEDEKAEVLQLFHNLMDHVERTQISEDDIPEFRDTRIKDYRLLLVQEGRVGDNACVETLDLITKREIAAGRLSPDDELRRVTLDGLSIPHLSRAELESIAAGGKQSIWSKMFGKR